MGRMTLPSGTEVEVVRPEGGGGGSGLVIAPDIWGLRPLFDEMVARISAEQGWAVAAVEPFPGQDLPADSPDPRFAAVAALDDQRLVGDLVAAAERLGTSRTGLVGFCMGGMYALKAADTGAFQRIVSFYGMIRVPVAWRGAGHREPLDRLAARSPRTQVLAIVGGRDPYTPREDVDALRRLEGVTVAEYPDAEHGFVHDPSRPAHRPADAADAWSRAMAFLAS